MRREKKKPWDILAEWCSHQISNKHSKHFKVEEPLPLLPLGLVYFCVVSQVTTTGFV